VGGHCIGGGASIGAGAGGGGLPIWHLQFTFGLSHTLQLPDAKPSLVF